MRSTMHLECDANPLDLDAGNFGEYARLYAANPLYRAATFDDRVIEDDPYRRPVRPDDLEWIDYSKPVTRANAQELTSMSCSTPNATSASVRRSAPSWSGTFSVLPRPKPASEPRA